MEPCHGELRLAERMAVTPIPATGCTVGLEFIVPGLHEVLHLRADIELVRSVQVVMEADTQSLRGQLFLMSAFRFTTPIDCLLDHPAKLMLMFIPVTHTNQSVGRSVSRSVIIIYKCIRIAIATHHRRLGCRPRLCSGLEQSGCRGTCGDEYVAECDEVRRDGGVQTKMVNS